LVQTAQAWEAEHGQQAGTHEESRDVTAAWARQLNPTSAVDRAAAGEAVGRYGPDVDANLASTYPGLLTAATNSRTVVTGAEAEALVQQQRENTEALTAESASRTLRCDDVLRGQGGDEDFDREEAAIMRDGEAAEHRACESQAGSEADRVRDENVTGPIHPRAHRGNHQQSAAEHQPQLESYCPGPGPDSHPRARTLNSLYRGSQTLT